MKFIIRFAKMGIKRLINECFSYLKSEAALTTNDLDDKTVAYIHKKVLEFFDNV